MVKLQQYRDPKLECDKLGDLINQVNKLLRGPVIKKVDDISAAPNTEPSLQQDSAVVDQGSNEEGAGESSEGSKGAKRQLKHHCLLFILPPRSQRGN